MNDVGRGAESSAAREAAGRRAQYGWLTFFGFLLLTIAVVGVAWFGFQRYKAEAKAEKQFALAAISQLKAAQIAGSFREHRHFIEVAAADPVLGQAIRTWNQPAGAAPGPRRGLLDRLEAIRRIHRYEVVSLLDQNARLLASTEGGARGLDSSERDIVREAMRTGRPRWIDIHFKADQSQPFIDIVAPVMDAGGGRPEVVGALMFEIDPNSVLYPVVQTWPLPTSTAETFVFRKDGQDIVYLNTLRHRDGPPFSVRVSADRPLLLAAQLLRRGKDVLEGEDYRRVPVVGAGTPIEELPWFLVSKIDIAEIYAPIDHAERIVLASVIGFICLIGSAIWFWWSQREAALQVRNLRQTLQQKALARHHDLMMRHAHDVILLADESGRILDINDRGMAVYGYSHAELLCMNVRDLRADEARSAFEADWGQWNENGVIYETVQRRRDGTLFPVEVSGRVVAVSGKRFHQAVNRDISERKEAEKRMRLYQSVFETTGEAVVITDAAQNIISVNPAFCEITGYSAEEAVGQTPKLLYSGRQDREFYAGMWASLQATGRWEGEIWNRRKNGEIYPEWEHISTVRDAEDRITHYVAIFSDISERKHAEERISHLAQHDALTGLPNRVLMHDRLTQAINAARRNGNRIAVMLIDLDRFKKVNDSLGHPAGDQLLREVGARLSETARQSDTVSRIGGDEFVVILPAIAHVEDAAHAGRSLLEALAAPFSLCGHQINVTPSIGVSIYPEDGDSIESLIRSADTAMYQAKESGRNNCQFFTSEMNTRVIARLTMETDLRNAFDRNEFLLQYQRQIEIGTGRIIGVEALLRWDSPKRGRVPPGEFIPVAEDSGLIIALGEWILHSACRQRRDWTRRGLREFPVSVNVSALQFRDSAFDHMVARVLQATGLAPALLDLELTESSVMRHGEETVGMLQRLKTLGVSLSIDDFGTGYSSLAYLKRFPIDRLKIDRSFVRDLVMDSNDREIVRAVVALGHSLNLRVLAEGVETEEQFGLIERLGCDECQGYLTGRPVAAEEIPALIGREQAGGCRSAR